jgi:hypothetical protein
MSTTVRETVKLPGLVNVCGVTVGAPAVVNSGALPSPKLHVTLLYP